eukprot:scaffold17768_cov31-Tisochrysis_lutea.AAC.4
MSGAFHASVGQSIVPVTPSICTTKDVPRAAAFVLVVISVAVSPAAVSKRRILRSTLSVMVPAVVKGIKSATASAACPAPIAAIFILGTDAQASPAASWTPSTATRARPARSEPAVRAAAPRRAGNIVEADSKPREIRFVVPLTASSNAFPIGELFRIWAAMLMYSWRKVSASSRATSPPPLMGTPCAPTLGSAPIARPAATLPMARMAGSTPATKTSLPSLDARSTMTRARASCRMDASRSRRCKRAARCCRGEPCKAKAPSIPLLPPTRGGMISASCAGMTGVTSRISSAIVGSRPMRRRVA